MFIDNQMNTCSVGFHPSVLLHFEFDDINKVHPREFMPQIMRHVEKNLEIKV